MKPLFKQIPMALFLAAECFLYYLILTTGGNTLVISSFSAIVLCFLFALLHIRSGKPLFLAALACTVGADYCLIMCNPIQQLYGMIFFLFAQGFYAWQLHSTCKHTWLLYLRIGLTAAGAAVTFLVLGDKADPLAVVSVCYYANLIMNIVLSWLQFSRYRLAAIGFILFLLCDTVIGLQVASTGYLPIPEGSWLHHVIFSGFNLSWLFYLPSQVLLSLCSTQKTKE